MYYVRRLLFFVVLFFAFDAAWLVHAHDDVSSLEQDSPLYEDIATKAPRKFSPVDFLDTEKLATLMAREINTDEPFKADITYLFADLKYDGKNLKILEFGQGKQGGYRTYDGVFTVGQIWKDFWNYSASFGLPIFFVAQRFSDRPINKIGLTFKQRFAWDEMKKVGGHYYSSLGNLERSEEFKAAKQEEKPFDPKSIASYKAILVYRYRDDRSPGSLRSIELFKKRHPDILVLDRASRPYAANKELMNALLFGDPVTAKYRPQSKVYSKRPYNRNVARAIKNDFPGVQKFVIKPLDSGMSNGVVVVSRKKLKKALQRIVRGPKSKNAIRNHYFNVPHIASSSSFNYRPTDTVTWQYWIGDRNPGFIVEEYIPSKEFTVKGKKYDPTLRMTFAMHYDQGEINMEFFECWWKISSHPLDSKGTLTSKHVSKFRGDLKQIPPEEVTVSPEDLADIKKQLMDVMPKAYLNMLNVKKQLDEKDSRSY